MRCLVTAIGSMSAEAVIKALVRDFNAKVVGCNMHPKEWTAASRLVERFHQVPPAQETSAYLARMLRICEADRISHLVPLTDPEVDVLSAARAHFEAMGVTVCISPASAVGLARDKLAVYQCFSKHPRVRPIPTADCRESSGFEFPFPLLAKPRTGRSSEGHIVLQDERALQFWLERTSSPDYVIQPRLTGEVFVVDVVRQPDGQKSASMTRKELLRTHNGAGMVVQMQPGHACDALAVEATEKLGLHGCINMEFLLVDGVPLLMDVNPRFSAGVTFSIMSGYNMVKNHLRCFGGGQIDPGVFPLEKIFTRGFVEYSIGAV